MDLASSQSPAQNHRLVQMVESILQSDPLAPENLDGLYELFDENQAYLLFVHELNQLRKTSLKNAFSTGELSQAIRTEALFDAMEERYAARYLATYLEKLERRNHFRILHINTLVEKSHLIHFEDHLQWMQDLIHAIRKHAPDEMPETDHRKCHFGDWLKQNARAVIRNNSHMQEIEEIHAELHKVAYEIEAQLRQPELDSHRLHALTKLAELLSLELGTEISLIQNVIIMRSYSKDALTGMLSRHALDKVMFSQMEIAKATDASFALIMCDLDHFKAINDTYGHLVGDDLIRLFARITQETLRKSDLTFRFGGEEFLFLLPSTNAKQARKIAQKILDYLYDRPYTDSGDNIRISASFGVFEFQPMQYELIDKDCLETILKSVDDRLYRAKRTGRNRVI